ncbi:HNH endonuclease [Streptomyces sp. NPDC056105]|uniref:HNH endonuclease signature motif containing protein n=1 Tax=Streptomyces sp. NPDC056105 TaxID=3345714 RepID=UPI0035D85B6F
MKAKYPRAALEDAARVSTSMVDLMRRIEAPMGNKPLRYLHKRLDLYGIDTSHFQDEPLPERPKRSYSRDVLAEAAANSTSIREMFQYMGIPPEDGPYSLIKRKLTKFGIDASHFDGARGSLLFSEEELTQAVAASRSVAGVLLALGVPPANGTAHAKVKRSIDVYGLSTEHFTGQGHNVGTVSPLRLSAPEILILKEPGTHRTRTTLLRRALDDIGRPHVCAQCDQGELWRGKRLVLEIDHIDGNPLDNRQDNLRYLCPSCHSQTGTFSNRRRQTQ